MTQIDIDSGKYCFKLDDNGNIAEVLKDGMPWTAGQDCFSVQWVR